MLIVVQRIAVLAFVGLLLLGWPATASAGTSPAPAPVRPPAEAASPLNQEPGGLELLWEAWRLIQEHFLDRSAVVRERLFAGAALGLGQHGAAGAVPTGPSPPTDRSARPLAHAAIRGMVRGLGDPNTVFLTPEERRVAIAGFSGHLEGIGACLELRDGRAAVAGLVAGSPAAEAGLRAGDLVVAIDGHATAGRPLRELVVELRGPRGTTVELTVQTTGAEGAAPVALERAEIRLPSTHAEALEPGIGLVRIVAFTEGTDAEVGDALATLDSRGTRALVLDLRGNLGGLLEPAVAVASRFIASSPIVRQENAGGELYDYERRTDRPPVDWPMAILVDASTASASEVLAMALRDAERAPLIGRPTYGKGTVQYLFELSDGSGLHLTAARWISPAGHRLDDRGLTPDIWVTGQTIGSVDPALDEAVRLLRPAIGSERAGSVSAPDSRADECSPNSANAA